jgi:hypothetical protein
MIKHTALFIEKNEPPVIQLLDINYEQSGLSRCKRPALAVAFSVFIHVNSFLCFLYHPDCLRQIFEPGDFEQQAALSASYATVGGAAIERPFAATSRAFCNNVHCQRPFNRPVIKIRGQSQDEVF